MRNTQLNKLFNALFAALKYRSVNFIKTHVLVMLKKSSCLRVALIIQIRVYTTSLNDVFQVEVGLSVPDQIDFFDAQFCCILALPLPITVGSVEEYARALRKQAQK